MVAFLTYGHIVRYKSLQMCELNDSVVATLTYALRYVIINYGYVERR